VAAETPINRNGWKKVKRQIFLRNLISFLKIVPYNHLCCISFKTLPSAEVRIKMNKMGYFIIDLPENPYLATMAESK